METQQIISIHLNELSFKDLVAKLNRMRAKGLTATPNYRMVLAVAQRKNPNPRTPVGFYLD